MKNRTFFIFGISRDIWYICTSEIVSYEQYPKCRLIRFPL